MRKSIVFFLILTLIISFFIFVPSCSVSKSSTITTEADTTVTQEITGTQTENTEADASIETSIKYPEPSGFVNDFASIFTDDEKSQINDFVSNFEKETTAEIFVVTVNSLEGLSIEQYASELFNSWGLGKKDVNNGMLLLISIDDKELRISTGLGLEKAVTDDEAGKIINDVIVPYFKEGKFGQGVLEGVKTIAKEISAGN